MNPGGRDRLSLSLNPTIKWHPPRRSWSLRCRPGSYFSEAAYTFRYLLHSRTDLLGQLRLWSPGRERPYLPAGRAVFAVMQTLTSLEKRSTEAGAFAR